MVRLNLTPAQATLIQDILKDILNNPKVKSWIKDQVKGALQKISKYFGGR